MRMIINADDFALRESVSLAICECFRRHLITQTTVMVNMPFFPQSVVMAKEEGFFDRIGLHLNLTYGFPLTTTIRKSRLLCNPDGSFSGCFHLSYLHRLWLPRSERLLVAEEVEAQMERYVNAGFPLMHLDSHHHSHTDDSVTKIVLPLAERFGFRSIRLSRNLNINSMAKRLYKRIVNRRLKQSPLATCDYFAGCVSDVARALSVSIPESSTWELMVHPRYEMIDGKYVIRNDNLFDFRTPIDVFEKLVYKLREMNVELISFRDVQPMIGCND